MKVQTHINKQLLQEIFYQPKMYYIFHGPRMCSCEWNELFKIVKYMAAVGFEPTPPKRLVP